MSFTVHVRRAAELDIAEAQVWYESQRKGLGTEFRVEVSQIIDRIAEAPQLYQTMYRDVRRALVRRFSVSSLVSREWRKHNHSRLHSCQAGSGSSEKSAVGAV